MTRDPEAGPPADVAALRVAAPEVRSVTFLFGEDPARAGERPVDFPVVAVAGRSNVGKSTLVNKLTGRRAVARVGARPGLTREINYFFVEFSAGDDGGGRTVAPFVLADLPGHGYARASGRVRDRIGDAALRFVRTRDRLAAVILLNDCRRDPTPDEAAIRDAVLRRGAAFLLVPTKTDVLDQSGRHHRTKALDSAYGAGTERFDAGRNVPIDGLRARLFELVTAGNCS